jgi:MFS family permease
LTRQGPSLPWQAAPVTARRIVRTYMALVALYTLAASLIWGVNTLFLLDAGLAVGEVFVVNAVFSAGMVLFEIPTGVVADTLGRRVSYLAGAAVLAGTTVLYLLAAEARAGAFVFALVSLVMGLGFTFFSGALEAWLVDALATVGTTEALDPVFARSQQVSGVAMIVGTVSGGFLGQVDLALPYIVRSGLLVVVFAVAWGTMHDIGFEPRALQRRDVPVEIRRQAQAGITSGWRQPGLRRLMLAALVWGSFSGWAFYASQPYLLELVDGDAVWFVGVVTALVSLATIAGNQVVEILARRCGRRSTLLIAASAVGTVAAVVTGLAPNAAVAVTGLLVLAASSGVMSPVRQAYLHQVTPASSRATVVSFDSMVSSAGGVGGQLGLGAVSDRRSYEAGYVIGGTVTLLALPVLWSLRRLGGVADRIVGRAAVQATCVDGLPGATAIEPVPARV